MVRILATPSYGLGQVATNWLKKHDCGETWKIEKLKGRRTEISEVSSVDEEYCMVDHLLALVAAGKPLSPDN